MIPCRASVCMKYMGVPIFHFVSVLLLIMKIRESERETLITYCTTYFCSQEGYCHCEEKDNCTVVKFDTITTVRKRSEKALQHGLASFGPASIAINVNKKSFKFYSSGVYDDPDCGKGPIFRSPYSLILNLTAYEQAMHWHRQPSGNYNFIPFPFQNCGNPTGMHDDQIRLFRERLLSTQHVRTNFLWEWKG